MIENVPEADLSATAPFPGLGDAKFIGHYKPLKLIYHTGFLAHGDKVIRPL